MFPLYLPTTQLPSPAANAAGDAFVGAAGIAARLAVVRTTAVVALVRVRVEPIAGLGPLLVDGRSRAAGNGHRLAGEILLANGGQTDRARVGLPRFNRRDAWRDLLRK